MPRRAKWKTLAILAGILASCSPAQQQAEDSGSGTSPEATRFRVATFNIEDLRGDELADPGIPRLQAAAEILQRIRPDILLINEMAFDQPGSPGWVQSAGEGRNGRRFVENYLAVAQAPGLEPLRFQSFMAPVNTGISSGLDLDQNGSIVEAVPALPEPNPDGSPGRQSAEGRAYGGDSWGFGTFPGQYGSAVLLRDDFTLERDLVRTFQFFPWSRMPNAKRPIDPESREPWHSDEVWSQLRLSSKSHWDLPVRLPDGQVVHLLVSHPTPPAFDGPEGRNRNRNHDEIRFWSDYLRGAEYLTDDNGEAGGLAEAACFVILGDLNADPDEGSSLDNPIGTWLLDHPRVQGEFVPLADETGRVDFPDLDPDDTASWGLRVDYVLPSQGLEIVDGGVWRERPSERPEASDHFPVWLDLVASDCPAGG